MPKDLYFSKMLDFYNSALKDRQKEVMNLYYNDDLSLSEIADNIGISKQGVRDIIKRAEDLLLKADKKFNLIKRSEEIQKNLENILICCESLKKSFFKDNLKDKENIEKNICVIEDLAKKSLKNNF